MLIKKGLILLLAMLSFTLSASERADTGWQLIEEGALLVDVRTQEEFQQGHLKTAVNYPLHTIHIAFSNIDRDREIVVYCRSGNRSGQAQQFLRQNGFTRVHNAGGLQEMLEAKPSN